MSGFTKLQASIIHSTIWREPDHIRIVWITMLAMADSKGRVEGSVPGLADIARVSFENCQLALLRLSSPDPWSRDPDNEGRRIKAIRGGWLILNYMKYRDPLSTERVRRYRARKQEADETVTCVSETEKRYETPETDPEEEADLIDPSLRSGSVPGVNTTVPTSEEVNPPSYQLTVFTPETDRNDTTKKGSKVAQKKPPLAKVSKGGPTWERYSMAYRMRYSVDPVRNAKTNSLCAQLVDRLGSADAPEVAEYYLTHNAKPYVGSGHALTLLLRDAEKLRTEWATGRKTTSYEAQENDRLQGMGDAWMRVAEWSEDQHTKQLEADNGQKAHPKIGSDI